MHQTSPFSTSCQHPRQINRSQAWLSKGRSTQNLTLLGKPQCVSLRSLKPCKCQRKGHSSAMPQGHSSWELFADRPLLAVRGCGISHCFHTKHLQVRMYLQFVFILGLNQLICRMNSLPFSSARLSATGIERKLHHHLLLISISPRLAAAILAVLVGGVRW